MQATFNRSTLSCATASRAVAPRQRCVAVQANKDLGDVCKRSIAAVGATMMILSPFAGPALARPSDFIQSKPGKDSTEATNEDKFPYNPSVSGNQAREDTGSQKNTQATPKAFSNNAGLGDKNITNDKPLPDPVDTAPNPDKTGRSAF